MLTQDELKKLMDMADKAEKEGKLGGGEFKELPDGEYYGKIGKAARGVTKKGFDKVELVLEITEGEFTRRLHWVTYLLEHDNPKVAMISLKNLDKLAKDLEIIHEPSNIADYPIEDVLEAFAEKEVRFRLITKGDFRNTYINAC